MTNQDKITSLLGFALKARKVVFGVDNINGRCKLLFVCKTASDNLLKNMEHLSNKYHIKLLSAPNSLDSYLHTTNCKAIGIKDKSMANAMLDFIENKQTEFFLIRTEVHT